MYVRECWKHHAHVTRLDPPDQLSVSVKQVSVVSIWRRQHSLRHTHHDILTLTQVATYAVSRPRKTTCDDEQHDAAHHIVQRN
jgi:hypothetical protein